MYIHKGLLGLYIFILFISYKEKYMGFAPDIPDPVTPAARPERKVDVTPDDIVLGSKDITPPSEKGKKQLTRPRGNTPTGSKTAPKSGVVV